MSHPANVSASTPEFTPSPNVDFVTETSASGPSATGQSAIRSEEKHTLSTIYPNEAQANGVKHELLKNGFNDDAVQIIKEYSAHSKDGTSAGSSDEVIHDVVVDGVIGGAVGAGIGALGTVALIAASATLFVASPIIAPLALIGNLATAGGLIGAAVGAARKDITFSEIVMEAIQAGNVILTVTTYGESEKSLAKKIIDESLKGRDIAPNET